MVDIYNTGEADVAVELNTGTFFEKFCPMLLQAYKERVQKIGGRFGFCIVGANTCAWVLDLKAATITEGAGQVVDVNITAWTEDFDAFLTGKADALQLIQEKKIFFNGNPEKLRNLALFLSLAS